MTDIKTEVANVFKMDDFRAAVGKKYSHLALSTASGATFHLLNPMRMEDDQRKALHESIDALTEAAEDDATTPEGEEVETDTEQGDDEGLALLANILLCASDDKDACNRFLNELEGVSKSERALVLQELVTTYFKEVQAGEA